jgi:DNA mismatch endonuclease (patch repair protein)
MERALRQHLPGGVFSSVTARASKNLSAVRGRGNRTTELRLRLALVRARITGWNVQPFGLPGNPDFVFPRERIAIFVDGCFWHGCPRCGHIPKTNSPFWQAKIQRNIERDRANIQKLRESDFIVTRIWEHELKSDLAGCVVRIASLIKLNRTKRSKKKRR